MWNLNPWHPGSRQAEFDPGRRGKYTDPLNGTYAANLGVLQQLPIAFAVDLSGIRSASNPGEGFVDLQSLRGEWVIPFIETRLDGPGEESVDDPDNPFDDAGESDNARRPYAIWRRTWDEVEVTISYGLLLYFSPPPGMTNGTTFSPFAWYLQLRRSSSLPITTIYSNRETQYLNSGSEVTTATRDESRRYNADSSGSLRYDGNVANISGGPDHTFRAGEASPFLYVNQSWFGPEEGSQREYIPEDEDGVAFNYGRHILDPTASVQFDRQTPRLINVRPVFP